MLNAIHKPQTAQAKNLKLKAKIYLAPEHKFFALNSFVPYVSQFLRMSYDLRHTTAFTLPF